MGGAHRSIATVHPIGLQSGSPEGAPEQEHRHQAHNRSKSFSRSDRSVERRIHTLVARIPQLRVNSQSAGRLWYGSPAPNLWRRGLKHVHGHQPSLDQFGPDGYRERGAAKAVAVSTFRVDVQFGGNLRVLQGLEIHRSVFDVDRIVFGLHDERWRSFVGDVDIGIGRHVLLRD